MWDHKKFLVYLNRTARFPVAASQRLFEIKVIVGRLLEAIRKGSIVSLFRRTGNVEAADKPKDPLDINPDEWRVSTRRLTKPGDRLARVIGGVPDLNQIGYILTREEIDSKKETPTFARSACCIQSKGFTICCFEPITHVTQLTEKWVIIEPKEPIATQS